jgi:GDP-D-mannose dehydratase
MPNGTRAEALIVGAGGQDAQFLTRAIISRGQNVLNLSKNQLKLNSLIIEEFEKIEYKSLEENIKNYSVDFVYFTAANSYSAGQRNTNFDSNYDEKNKIVEQLLVECLAAIQSSGRKIKLIYFSSALRFGELKSIINEKSVSNPLEPYGEHKIVCEEIIHEHVRHNSNIEFLIPYFFNHTSHLSKPSFLFKKISSAVLNHDKAWLLDQLSVTKKNPSYIDIGSAKEYMEVLISLAKSEHQGSFIFSTGITFPISYFFQAGLNLVTGKNLEELYLEGKVPFTADNSKLMSTLNLSSHSFSYGLTLLEEVLCNESSK